MKIVVDKKIFEKFPGIRLGVVVATDVDNSNQGLFMKELVNEQTEVRNRLTGVEISSHEYIAPWREIYRSFGSKPSEYNSSIESLLKRVIKGKELFDINPLVNLYNQLSLKYLLPFGGEDLDKVDGDIKLTFVKGNEVGEYLGSDDLAKCEIGEVAYLDNKGFICRKWNWREGKRTMLTNDTRNVILVIEAVSNVDDDVLKDATRELAEGIEIKLGGKTVISYLNENNYEFEFTY